MQVDVNELNRWSVAELNAAFVETSLQAGELVGGDFLADIPLQNLLEIEERLHQLDYDLWFQRMQLTAVLVHKLVGPLFVN